MRMAGPIDLPTFESCSKGQIAQWNGHRQNGGGQRGARLRFPWPHSDNGAPSTLFTSAGHGRIFGCCFNLAEISRRLGFQVGFKTPWLDWPFHWH